MGSLFTLRDYQALSATAVGQELLYLQPGNTTWFGELSVAQQSFGRVREGQRVMVRFSGYPYHEFGSVYGEVEYFSEFPVRDSLFLAKVHFPDGLLTSYGHDIPPRNGMTGRAEIITQGMRLLERVYNNITKELR
ncbi:HlyD family efflux transporter periplasmic adaptor subunit [Pleurocapsales cyanobacterium LEGE 10410]|nr:HlyD family efflux transporter periplasmic adaptor subunit [Pleurocapsales cyanobacterium LEGE 10410]